MKKIVIIILLALIAAGVYYAATNKDAVNTPNNNPGENQNQSAERSEDMEEISFTYPEGYVLLEQNSNGSVANLNKTLVIMQEADYASVQNGEREGGEGPAAITIQEYKNPEGLSARAWAEQNVQLSNFQLMSGTATNTEVAGLPAIRYNADGLYTNRNVVFAKDGLIYYLSGAYMDDNSDLYRDFDTIIESIEIK